ncbi:DUF3025 domain-containing protein [Alteromonas sp. NFXS44]|uniref:DUF3025 domain-containing protein n=1 Tax=Alteromonas sp. NFXS44 TaxID=2818435 RepID=UPI0032DEA3AE
MNSTAESWSSAINRSNLAFSVRELLTRTGLDGETEFPSAAVLNDVVRRHHPVNWPGPEFKGQSSFALSEQRYYEQIIFEDNVVPTRENSWHDLFNALIWLQFPLTKRCLNNLHMQDISRFGVSPRTPARNRITHFDECGVVIAVPDDMKAQAEPLLNALAMHNWQQVLVEHRDKWGQLLFPVIFGHANLEMLLNPFTGLTGKWMAVTVPPGFASMSFEQQCRETDCAMEQKIASCDVFQSKGMLHPLPLLGVPGWYPVQDRQFYASTDYFRAVSSKKQLQMPLI